MRHSAALGRKAVFAYGDSGSRPFFQAHTRRITGALGLVVAAMLSCPAAEGFCQVLQPRLLCAEYSNSRGVVTAKLLREKVDGDTGWSLMFAVTRTFRGGLGRTLVLWEENSSGRATFKWKVGGEYLLFVRRSGRSEALAIDGCGNSGPVEALGAEIAQVEGFAKDRGRAAVIGVVTTGSWTTGVPDVIITASGLKGTTRVVSDRAGKFEFWLEPGRYDFHASKTGARFAPGIGSYKRADGLELRMGSCAQIQLEQQ